MKTNVRKTSRQAYNEIKENGKLGDLQKKVLNIIASQKESITDKELKEKFNTYFDANFDVAQITPRRNELCKMGMVVEDSKRKCKITGSLCITWKLNFNYLEEVR